MNRRWRGGGRAAVGLAVLAGCAAGARPDTGTGLEDCPPPTGITDTLRFGSIVIDGVVAARGTPFRLESSDPPTYAVVGEEPPALARLPVERIELVQFVSDPQATRRYDRCPGIVVMIISTRRPS